MPKGYKMERMDYLYSKLTTSKKLLKTYCRLTKTKDTSVYFYEKYIKK